MAEPDKGSAGAAIATLLAETGYRLAAQSDPGHLAIRKDAFTKQAFLRNRSTGEWVLLPNPPHGETWELDFNEKGIAYIDSGSESKWLSV